MATKKQLPKKAKSKKLLEVEEIQKLTESYNVIMNYITNENIKDDFKDLFGQILSDYITNRL